MNNYEVRVGLRVPAKSYAEAIAKIEKQFEVIQVISAWIDWVTPIRKTKCRKQTQNHSKKSTA